MTSSTRESELKSGDVPTILGSMLFFKKRAQEYFDELQKEKKVHAELQWEVEVYIYYLRTYNILIVRFFISKIQQIRFLKFCEYI